MVLKNFNHQGLGEGGGYPTLSCSTTKNNIFFVFAFPKKKNLAQNTFGARQDILAHQI